MIESNSKLTKALSYSGFDKDSTISLLNNNEIIEDIEFDEDFSNSIEVL